MLNSASIQRAEFRPHYNIERHFSLCVLFFVSFICTSFGPSKIGCCQSTATAKSNESKPETAPEPHDQRDVLVVIGAPGEEAYAKEFRAWAERWKSAIQTGTVRIIDGIETIDNEPNSTPQATDKQLILDWIEQRSDNTTSQHPTDRWIVFIGHGTDDRGVTKFNLRGPDITAQELSKTLEAKPARWTIINCHASSGPFINALSKKDRVIITATKSGSEQNYSRFGGYLSTAITAPDADLDHDRAVSLLEAFLAASNRTAQFYADENRLASEQALLDDNGDNKGTPAAFYRGTRAVKAPAEGMALDGSNAGRIIVRYLGEVTVLSSEEEQKLTQLEADVDALRKSKSSLGIDEYYSQLEKLFLQIAEIRLKPAAK